jgi:hypothetical protein
MPRAARVVPSAVRDAVHNTGEIASRSALKNAAPRPIWLLNKSGVKTSSTPASAGAQRAAASLSPLNVNARLVNA